MTTKRNRKDMKRDLNATNLQHHPLVRITRSSALDKVALSAKKVNSQNPSCFLCGEVTSVTRRLTHYFRQVKLFKTYLPPNGDDRVETCANCVQEVKAVWELTQQIKAIKREIAKIVGKVTGRKGDNQALVTDQFKGKDYDEVNGFSCRGTGLDLDVKLVHVKEEIEIPYCIDSRDEYIPQNEDLFQEMVTIELKLELDEEEGAVSHEFKTDSYLRQGSRLIKRMKRPERDPLALSDEEDLEEEIKDTKILLVGNGSNLTSTCPHCGKVLSSRGSLTSHIRFVHRGYRRPKRSDVEVIQPRSDILKKFICPFCDKELSARNKLRGHINFVHLGHRPYKCLQCEKAYKAKQSLADHVNWIHNQESIPCSRCRKELATKKRWAIQGCRVS